MSAIFRSMVVRSCGGCSGRRTRSGCGSKVATVDDEAALAGALDGRGDHPPVAEMDPVEGAERERAAGGRGGDIRQ